MSTPAAIMREQGYSVTGLAHCDLPMETRALCCLYEADRLALDMNGSDLAIPLWLAAAQTFATLAVVGKDKP